MDEIERSPARSARGMRARSDARGAQWTKLLFNAATNPLAALTGLTHGELCDSPGLRAPASALVAEGRAVADALGITLDGDPDELITPRGAREPRPQAEHAAGRRSPAGRPRSTRSTAGSCARAQAGVPTPLHATIAALIAGLEAAGSLDMITPLSDGELRIPPDVLLQGPELARTASSTPTG